MVAGVLAMPLAASAGDDKLSADQILARYRVENTAQRMAESVFRQFSQAATVLEAVNVMQAEEVGPPGAMHRSLGWLIDGLPALRAVIVVDPDGQLRHDSATLPTPNLNLRDRSYFINAPDRTRARPFIGTPIIGRSSSLPFLAVSQRLDNGAVVVGMINPDSLIPPHFRCSTCTSAVLSDQGEVLASVPSGYAPTPDLVRAIQTQGGSGRISVLTGHLPALLAWSRVDIFNLTTITTVLLP